MGATPSVPLVDLPQDRTFLITGANTGIGYETAKKIAQCGGRVIMACRSGEKANEAIERMKQETQTEFAEMKEMNAQNSTKETKEAPSLNVQYMHLDLSKLQSTMDFINLYKESGLPINVLLCNAGMLIDKKVITEDGYEIHFQVNYLSHLLLTLHLLPLIKQSGPNSRIVNISSIGHFFSEVNLDNIQSQQHFNGIKCYGKSKLYQIMSMYQLAKRLDKDTVSVFSVHPGFVQTNLLNSETTFINRLFIGAFVALGLSRKPVDGAIGPLIAALDPGFNGQTALYLSGERPTNPYAIARDEAKQEIIWNYSLECLKKYLNDEILGEIGIKMDDIKTVKHSVGECEGTDVDKMEGNVDKEEGHVDKKGLL